MSEAPPANLPPRALRRAVCWGCATALAIVVVGMTLIIWTESSAFPGSPESARAWHSNGLSILITIGMYSFFGFPAWAVATLAASLAKRYRAGAYTALQFGACFVGTFTVVGFASPGIYTSIQVPLIVRRVSHHGEPIIAALERYHSDHGEYPPSLDGLVPNYLTAVPRTGIGVDPEFQYTLPGGDNDLSGVDGLFSYDLWVGRAGLFNHIHFWPEGNYPERVPGAAIQTVGRWGLVHE